MPSWASAEPRLGPLQDPKSELPPRRNASFCFGCVFSCALVLAALELLLGLLLARFWVPKWAPDRPRSRPRSVLKMEPKNDPKSTPKRDPKTDVKIENFWQKRATGATGILAQLVLGGALTPSWFSSPLRWPKGHFLTATRAKCGP